MDLVEKAFVEAGFDADAIEKIADETDAIQRALSLAGKGDLVCIMSGRVEKVIQHLERYQQSVEAPVSTRDSDPPG
jgi:UDP-N-acetylmuramyl tripeptide synthase